MYKEEGISWWLASASVFQLLVDGMTEEKGGNERLSGS